jgi:lipopolysaccharide export system protein LptA
MAVREDKRLSADVLVGHLARDAQGGEKIDRIDAFDNVAIVTPTDIVRGNQGVYNVETGIATLTGSVKITRGDSQLNGDRAEVDLNSGQSRLLSGPGGPVRGVFVPDKGSGRPGGPAAPGKQP